MARMAVQLDLERRSTEPKDFEAALPRKIVGQGNAGRTAENALRKLFR